MNSGNYPKVLIIGAPFNKVNGGGITMSNLFRDWPLEKLALASNDNILLKADFSSCNNYYQLGYNDKLHPFPLSIVLPKIKCGPVSQHINSTLTDQNQQSGGKHKRIYRLIYKILTVTGLFNIFYSMKITDGFRKWLLDFSPDIIYCQLASLVAIRLVNDVQDYLKKPVAIHIMDDWPMTINKVSILFFYWKRKTDSEFYDLISKSKVLLSISQGMSDEYKKRYNRIFDPFHNPVTIDNWLPYSKTNWEIKNDFKVLYTGRVGVANSKSIFLIAKVIHDLNMKGSNILLDIYTPDYQSKQSKRINSLTGINVKKTVENKFMPKLLADYDLLLLPLDFDDYSVQFAQLSMPTKASEYMISGTPVLVFADSSTFLAKHANDWRWAYVVSENSEKMLTDAIILLKTNIELRSRIAKSAILYATKYEDSRIINEEFRRCLNLER
jgi:glycosyltransferase involved in cell wall biosynthesis